MVALCPDCGQTRRNRYGPNHTRVVSCGLCIRVRYFRPTRQLEIYIAAVRMQTFGYPPPLAAAI